MVILCTYFYCEDCYEEFGIRADKEEKCIECGSTNLSFKGMGFVEKHPTMVEGEEWYFTEDWMESTGIPVCEFCINRDFDSEDPIEEGWLAKTGNDEPFIYYCACDSCKKEIGLMPVTRKELREETNRMFEEAEAIAEDARLMFEAKYENDLLNYGEKYVLREYHGYTDEDFEE